MAPKKQFKAADLTDLIRVKYSGDAYTVLEQVADGTGAGCTSWIDAAVFSLWPSNGIWRAACEVKVSRSDFLNELSNPNKNQWAREHFDFFWYVVAPGIAKDDEIPTGCGLMTVRGGGLSVVKQAPRREDVKTDKHVIASFARSLDKERQRFLKDGIREALQNDRDHIRAVAFEEGCRRYFKQCNEYTHDHTADGVFDALLRCASEKTPYAAESEHIQRALEAFQDHVVHFLLDVAPLAANVLNARDQAAEFIISRWGGRDKRSVEALKSSLKKTRRAYNQREREVENNSRGVREALKAVGGKRA